MNSVDHFQVLGLPRSPVVDDASLKRAYYDLNRRLHPDRHQTGSAAVQEESLQNTAAVNDAYRTLRDPIERGLYWLSLHGENLGANNNRVPPELAALVFEVQEQLEEIRDTRRSGKLAEVTALQAARDDIVERCAVLEIRLQENFRLWDTGGDAAPLLADLKSILSALAYLNTLLRDVDLVLEK